MTEYWVINGHQPNCAYLRSLDDPLVDDLDECDCQDDAEDFWDEDEELRT